MHIPANMIDSTRRLDFRTQDKWMPYVVFCIDVSMRLENSATVESISRYLLMLFNMHIADLLLTLLLVQDGFYIERIIKADTVIGYSVQKRPGRFEYPDFSPEFHDEYVDRTKLVPFQAAKKRSWLLVLSSETDSIDRWIRKRITKRNVKLVAMDTEFSNARLGTIQICTDKDILCIHSPRDIDHARSTSEFDALMSDSSIRKCFCSYREDIKYLSQYMSVKLSRELLDTWNVVDIDPRQMGTARMLARDHGMFVNTVGHVRTSDWTNPVLTSEQINYIIEDISVIYLLSTRFEQSNQ
jgi:hypothetical protein